MGYTDTGLNVKWEGALRLCHMADILNETKMRWEPVGQGERILLVSTVCLSGLHFGCAADRYFTCLFFYSREGVCR